MVLSEIKKVVTRNVKWRAGGCASNRKKYWMISWTRSEFFEISVWQKEHILLEPFRNKVYLTASG
jgi:hypothetical protein